MPVKSTATSEKEWWYAAWEWMQNAASEADSPVRVVVTPHTTPGVLRVRLQVCQVNQGRVAAVVAEADELWPQKGVTSLGAQVMNMVIRLDQTAVADAERLLREEPAAS